MSPIEKKWIAVDNNDRIVAAGETREEVHFRLESLLRLDADDYHIVAVPKVNPPSLV